MGEKEAGIDEKGAERGSDDAMQAESVSGEREGWGREG